jgi:hypothetical protein
MQQRKKIKTTLQEVVYFNFRRAQGDNPACWPHGHVFLE